MEKFIFYFILIVHRVSCSNGEELTGVQQQALTSREGLLPSASYNTFRRKFAAFVGVDFDPKKFCQKVLIRI
jgi:hypothetical protein